MITIDLETLVITIITTAIGLIMFILSYRWNVTAKKEREKNAYKEIVSISLRTIIQNQINPTYSMLEVLVNSKSREYEVERKNLPSVSVLLEDMASKILENEFIPHDIKEKLLDNIDVVRQQILKEKKVTVEKESETPAIVESALLGFLTLSVLLLLMVYVVTSVLEVTFTTSDMILSIAVGVLSLAAVAIGYISVTMKKEKPESNET